MEIIFSKKVHFLMSPASVTDNDTTNQLLIFQNAFSVAKHFSVSSIQLTLNKLLCTHNDSTDYFYRHFGGGRLPVY